MKIGVVILNWNQVEDTIACTQSVLDWSLPADIWIVDNASSAQSAAQIRQACPTAELLVNAQNLGFAGGNNAALREIIKGDYDAAMLLNNDAMIEETAVSHLITALHQHPQLGIVGPSLWDADRPQRLLSAGGGDIGLAVHTHLYDLPPAGQIQPVAYVPGTCILIRTSVLQDIGLLDESYFFGGEVADLCARAQQQGYGCAIVGGVKAYHAVHRSADVRHHLHIYYVLRNRFLFVRKFHPQQKWRLFAYWTRQCMQVWGSAVLNREWARARAVMLACWDGWNGRFGAQNQRVTKGAVQ